MDDEVLARLQPIFRDVFDRPKLTVARADSADTVEDWDSLAHIQLISAIEKEFRIKFALGELQTLKNVGDMVDLMSQKLR